MRSYALALMIPTSLILGAITVAARHDARAAEVKAVPLRGATEAWDRSAAAHYLDAREVWWQGWPKSHRDHETVCVSCHTVLPYALARPLLRDQAEADDFAAPERTMYDDVVKRVKLWSEVEPFYNDTHSGPYKSMQSRSTEAVLNALILASYDARSGHLSAVTRQAFDNAWALQQHTGSNSGAWIWLNFHNGPWESDVSEYWGATLGALAVERAPDHYMDSADVRPRVKELQAYLSGNFSTQPLVNQSVALWAAAGMSDLITPAERQQLLRSLAERQQRDGGWSLTDLGRWQRHDHTPLERASDGYATGLVVLALTSNGLAKLPMAEKGRMWLLTHQDRKQGDWQAYSLNKQHALTADGSQFMNEAATGYAVLALEQSER